MDIKFRAWSESRNKMLTPSEVTPVFCPSLIFCEYNSDGQQVELSLMQFTGLQDANGVDIYVGDIAKHKNGYIWTVFFDAEEARFALTSRPPLARSLYKCRADNVKVIGNIHQNAELIK